MFNDPPHELATYFGRQARRILDAAPHHVLSQFLYRLHSQIQHAQDASWVLDSLLARPSYTLVSAAGEPSLICLSANFAEFPTCLQKYDHDLPIPLIPANKASSKKQILLKRTYI